jgi:hypothetical protein
LDFIVYTFGFKPCVFDLRRLGQKTAFEINIGFQMYKFGFVFVFSNWFVFWSKATFGFKPCVFDLRQLGQKMAFEINIGLQMYTANTKVVVLV